jgi:hypothetical protein
MSVKLLVEMYSQLSYEKVKDDKELIHDFIRELDLYLQQMLEEDK